jgi:hypothetical protein
VEGEQQYDLLDQECVVWDSDAPQGLCVDAGTGRNLVVDELRLN